MIYNKSLGGDTMNLKASVVVKKDKKWFVGHINGFEFKENKQIKRLKDVKDVTNYKTLKSFLKDSDKDVSLEKVILEKTGLQSIYILEKPIWPDSEEFESWWWSDINKKCKDCELDCKQCSRVEVIKCQNDCKGNE